MLIYQISPTWIKLFRCLSVQFRHILTLYTMWHHLSLGACQMPDGHIGLFPAFFCVLA
uniref:Uncharacterized protein n=1 Tax=Arundo donax TaxID=35708 RepID=A0A0A9DY88_ARUDO